jgi:hypothetical protein
MSITLAEREAALGRRRTTRHDLTETIQRQAVRIRALRAQVEALEIAVDRRREPARSPECVKIRFHARYEAQQYAQRLEQASGLRFTVYPCAGCPPSPVTRVRYDHAAHVDSRYRTSRGRPREALRLAPAGQDLGSRLPEETLRALRRCDEDTAPAHPDDAAAADQM